MNTKIIFFPVKKTSDKLTKITSVATSHFEKGEPILFLVQDDTGWEFLDKLFWATPSDSFLPHPSKLIQIRHNLDPAFGAVFNLCPTPLFQESIKTLYELEDHTSPDRLKTSQDRYHAYRLKELQIIINS